MSKKIIKLVKHRPCGTVKDALRDVASFDPSDVLIVGYTRDGKLFTRSSNMTRERAYYMLECAKHDTVFV